jgi:RNA polymerase sigma-70 factor (ECF subfamily)
MADPADIEALALLRLRDPRGFDLAYRRHAANLRGFLRRMTRNDDLADDLLQLTYLRLAERGPELRADSDLPAWLFTVARNACYDQMRLTAASTANEKALAVLTSPPPDVEARLLLGDVEHALSRLKAEDREILLLVSIEGLSHEAVSKMLGLQSAATRQRLARARLRLLAALEKQLKEPTSLPQRTLA